MSLAIYFISFLCSVKFIYGHRILLSRTIHQKQAAFTSDLIEKCYPDVQSFLLIFEKKNLPLYSSFKYEKFGAINLMDNFDKYKTIPRDQRSPIAGAIFMSSSPLELNRTLNNSSWHNYEQLFFVVDSENTNCDNSKEFLLEAWKNDVLNCVFLCFDSNETQYIYTFNPFNDFAPKPWEKISQVISINNHPWTLFRQKFTNESCRGLFYEKTMNFGGYPIKLAAANFPPYVSYSIINETIVNISGYDYLINKVLWKKLNATYQIYDKYNGSTPSSTASPVTANSTQFPKKNLSLNKLISKERDFLMNSLIVRNNDQKVEFAHFVLQTGITAVTRHRGYLNSAQKLLSFLPLSIAVLFFFTSIFGYVVLNFIIKDPYSNNFIDILRVYLSSPLPKLPRTSRGRLFFGSILIVFMIINAVVQGNLAKIFTGEKSVRNIETLEDINKLNFTAVTNDWVGEVLRHDKVKYIKIIINDSLTCENLEPNEAYVEEELNLGNTAFVGDCHMPKKSLIPGLFHVYYARHRWPLFPKVKSLLLRLFESGLRNYWFEKVVGKKRPYGPTKYRPLTMDDMGFIFSIAIIGLFMSTIIFLFELWISRKKNNLQTNVL
ncbi:uncharacterized protein LOC130673236 [Microplitis mediator]|uniref:uncharacterized protein LOC130673236 n=1 Tax=Microplitis mediator TaxID=375433 RepID=UPI002553C842|nr:uncharacterized protein LOC130673236 [Microplitis mediator]